MNKSLMSRFWHNKVRVIIKLVNLRPKCTVATLTAEGVTKGHDQLWENV